MALSDAQLAVIRDIFAAARNRGVVGAGFLQVLVESFLDVAVRKLHLTDEQLLEFIAPQLQEYRRIESHGARRGKR